MAKPALHVRDLAPGGAYALVGDKLVARKPRSRRPVAPAVADAPPAKDRGAKGGRRARTGPLDASGGRVKTDTRAPSGRGNCVEIAVATPSRSNGSHGAWQRVKGRVDGQRKAVAAALARCNAARPRLPCGLVVTRISVGTMDAHDGLPGSQKAIVDAWCAWAGWDDGHPAFRVRYAQEKPTRASVARQAVRLEWHEGVRDCPTCGLGWVCDGEGSVSAERVGDVAVRGARDVDAEALPAVATRRRAGGRRAR